MSMSRGRRVVLDVMLAFAALLALVIGVSLGLFLSGSRNLRSSAAFGSYQPALPSQLLDRNGRLITEFFGSEKRELIPLTELPPHLIDAALAREDTAFYRHHGFSVRGLARAAWNLLTNQYHSGGSTITQQLAGTLYADRSDISIARKLKELWWAVQLERNLTKSQILELYLNESFFGGGTNGVEAAAQLLFGHSAREVSVAEAVMLMIQLANPAMHSPLRHPDTARRIQRLLLDQMVQQGSVTREAADRSFADYWQGYDYTRPASTSAYRENQSAAPYFSEYVRRELESLLFGRLDYLRDGLLIHTTLDLDHQAAAERVMTEGLRAANERYLQDAQARVDALREELLPVIHLLAPAFDLDGLQQTLDGRRVAASRGLYLEELNPPLDLVALLFDDDALRSVTRRANRRRAEEAEETTVEGALITLESSTGAIRAMVGGRSWERSQFNRAIDARVEPGSAIKPLYYSAAISSGAVTAATRLYDGPIVFFTEGGEAYRPSNFMGEWRGAMLLREALATSMNVPSLQVLETIGFDRAIERMARMLGMSGERADGRLFPRVYPLGLGITPVAPIDMARAYAVFPNQGREVTPFTVRYITDRDATVLIEPEQELRAAQAKRGGELEIMSPQAAAVMVSLLESTVEWGTLAGARIGVGGFDGMAMAGKTGTTYNWADAWTVGFSPYLTTAVWLGFDRSGSSLGLAQTGATAAGPLWARYMKEIHADLPPIAFSRPETGLVQVRIDARSGMLPTTDSGESYEELFIAGTEPRQFDTLHAYEADREAALVEKLQGNELVVAGSAPLADEPTAPPDGDQAIAIPPLDSLSLPDFDDSWAPSPPPGAPSAAGSALAGERSGLPGAADGPAATGEADDRFDEGNPLLE